MAQSRHVYDAMHHDDLHETANHAPILNSDEARQGVVSGRVMAILAASLALCVVAMVILLAATA